MIILNSIIGAVSAEQSEAKESKKESLSPPIASVKPHIRDIHHDQTVDEYYWMNDFFKKGPDAELVIDYLKKENDYTDALLKPTARLQEQLFQEMKARIQEKDESVPYLKNGYYYYTRTEEGKQYFKFCRKKDQSGAREEILLDIDAMAEGLCVLFCYWILDKP